MASVVAKSIRKAWGKTVVLKDLNLEIIDGEFLVLLGPSGCGKSTTMRIIAGLEPVSAGTLWMNGKDVTRLPPRTRNVAMVFQNYALYPHMNVAQNIGYPLKVARMNKQEARTKILETAQRVNLSDYLDRYPRDLSGGQRQRVALARALVRDPEVFLLDEPLSNLDAQLRVAMRAEIKHLHRHLGVTMIYVTHDQVEAMTLADRIVLLNEGEIQQLDTPDEIYDDPANIFVAGFIGSPAMNFVSGQVSGQKFKAPGAEFPAPLREGALTAGFRAEDVGNIELGNNGTGSSNAMFEGNVYEVEPTGECTFVVIQLGPTRVTVRAEKRFRPEIGAPIRFHVASSAILFFDTASGARVRTD